MSCRRRKIRKLQVSDTVMGRASGLYTFDGRPKHLFSCFNCLIINYYCMKNTFFAVFATLIVMAFTTVPQGLPIGADIPKADVKMKDVGGDLISLREVRTANGLLVMFSCNTCPYVIKNQSRAKAVCAFAKEKGIGVIVLNANEGGRNNGESLADMQAYAKQQSYNWYYALDSDNLLADAFGATRTPECFLFDKN